MEQPIKYLYSLHWSIYLLIGFLLVLGIINKLLQLKLYRMKREVVMYLLKYPGDWDVTLPCGIYKVMITDKHVSIVDPFVNDYVVYKNHVRRIPANKSLPGFIYDIELVLSKRK